MSSAAAADDHLETASAVSEGSDVEATLIGNSTNWPAPPLFCAEPSEVLGLATDQASGLAAAQFEQAQGEDDQEEKSWLLQEQGPLDAPRSRADGTGFTSCSDGPLRVNGNRVPAQSTSVLQCKACRREPAPFCPVTGSRARFCSYCGEALVLPSTLLEQELSASKIAHSLTRPSSRVAKAVAVTTGKAARTVKAIAEQRPFSYRAILLAVIIVACLAALIDVCFRNWLWAIPSPTSDDKTENANNLASRSSIRGVIALMIMLGTSLFFLYRRRGVLCCILDWRVMRSSWQRFVESTSAANSYIGIPSASADLDSMEAGQVSSPKVSSPIRRQNSEGGDSSGFETCGESDDSSDGEHARNSRQTTLLAWIKPDIREALLASWSAEQRSKVREVAAVLQGPGASRREQVMLSAFGNAEVCAWRFLRSSWDPATAGKKLQETARWRAEVLSQRPSLNGRQLFTESGCVPPVAATPAAKKVFAAERHVFPCVGWDGGLYEAPGSVAHGRWWTARDGAPIEFWQLKLVDSHEICTRCSQEELSDCYMEYNERRRERVNDLHAAGFIIVADAEGIGLSHVRKALRYAWRASLVLDMGERHYPGSVHRFICVNAPTLVHAVYKAVQPVLGSATRNSITITASPPEKVSELVRLLEPGTLEAMRTVFQ